MNKLITSILVCCFAFNLYAEQLPAKQFSHPERIRYDQHCFTIEGRDIFILSAAFHYFRVPQELWRDRFRKIKEAGFNTVETYVPWNWHERTMPRNVKDYSQCDFDDLKAWLKMAHEEFGLYTIVRPGPFICAEWAGGGYPRWVAKFCPAKYDTSFWLRSNHPEHMKWTKHWYDAVCPVFAEEQLTRKKSGEKGIIMVQLENEYIYFGMESEKKEEVLRDMAAYCTNNGIEVPLFTCVTPEVRGSKDAVISQLFDMDNQYVWWNIQEAKSRIEDLKRQQPNAPAFVCELQGGWFSTVGGGLSEDSYLDGRHARGMALMAMAGGSTGLNYYMFFGGTNLAGWGARRMTTSYDYGAALKESGGVGEKFAAVKGVGDFVNRFGTQLARSEAIEFTTSDNIKDLTVGVRRTKEGTLFIFIFNKDKKKAFRDNVQFHIKGMPAFNVYCSVEPLDSKVLVLSQANGQCEWYPKEQTLPERPVNMPMPIRIAQAERCDETFQGNWRPLRKGVSLPEIGVNDCRYSMYRSVVKLSKKEVEEYGTLVCEMFTADPLYVQVNGKIAKRASTDELDNTFVIDGLLHEGSNEIVSIYENRGHAHGYRPMEELSGMKSAGLGKKQSAILPIEKWEVKKVENNVKDIKSLLSNNEGWETIMLDQSTIANLATLQIAGLEKPEWPAAWVLQGKEGTAIYRTSIDMTRQMLTEGQTMIEFACVDDAGTLFVNGKEVASHDAWDKPFVANMKDFLHEGENNVAIVVRNSSGAGGLLKGIRLFSELKILKPLKWEVALDLGGVTQGYCGGKTAGGDNWKVVTLKTDGTLHRKGNNIQSKGKQDALLTWYKVTFDLPKTEKECWIPWRAIINASGTGYMWLNGHNIGRYWEEGPQREFFLPECWLNMGGTNTLVLGLRQSETCGAVLEGIEVAPYYEDAEFIK